MPVQKEIGGNSHEEEEKGLLTRQMMTVASYQL